MTVKMRDNNNKKHSNFQLIKTLDIKTANSSKGKTQSMRNLEEEEEEKLSISRIDLN